VKVVRRRTAVNSNDIATVERAPMQKCLRA
jgi:hypothetical protein